MDDAGRLVLAARAGVAAISETRDPWNRPVDTHLRDDAVDAVDEVVVDPRDGVPESGRDLRRQVADPEQLADHIDQAAQHSHNRVTGGLGDTGEPIERALPVALNQRGDRLDNPADDL